MVAMFSMNFIEEGYGYAKNTPETQKKELIVDKIKRMRIENSLIDLIRNLSINFQKKVVFFCFVYF